MSAHTPGPWCSDTGAIYAACQLDERGMTRESPIAEVGDGRPENYVSNCRLIAAAPELLEALEILMDDLGALTNKSELFNRLSESAAEKVYAAYAKATGAAP